MKKVLIPLALFVGVSVSAEAAIQTFSASDTGGSTRSKLNSNFSELDTTKETKAVVQASAPADTTVDWYDTDQEAGVLILKRHNGTTWIRASSHGVQYATSCASISAGMCVDTDDGKLYYHNGMAVVEVGTGDVSIPTASAETLGGVKIGSRLTITDGVLSADVQSGGFDPSADIDFTGDIDFSGANVTGITGTVPTGTENQIPVYNSSGALTATTPLTPVAGANITLTTDTTAGTVTIASTGGATYPGAGIPQSTGSSWGSSITPGTGVATALAAAVDGTGGLASKAALDAVTAGSFAFDTYPTYEDSAHNGSGIAVNGTTLAIYSSTAGKWLTVGLTDSLDLTPDLTPDALTFTDVTDAELSTQYTALAQITGITGGITCSGSGGTVAACTGSTEGTCGTFGATSGSITNNQYVGVRQTSSASNSTATNATATCGGVSDTFTVTTANSVPSCSTQSVLLSQTGSFAYNGEVYGSSGVAARFTGNGKALYSVKAKTGSIVGGTPGVWTVYVNTSLNFTGEVTDSFAISPPSTTSTEFSAQSTARPILENGVNYYVGFAKPGSAWGERAVFNVISGGTTSPANNYWVGNINGTMPQSTTGSLWLEVKTCD